MNGLTGICLWNNDYIFVGSHNNNIILIDIKNGEIIKNLNIHTDFVISLKKVKHNKFGECLVSQGGETDFIFLRKIN